METKIHFSSASGDWSTPQDFYDMLNEEFHFTLDPCADDHNHKCENYYTEAQDGLKQDWSGETVFCNPPYGRTISRWVEKAYNEVYRGECSCVVLLVPARTDTRWFHEYIYHKSEIRFIRKRLKFGSSKQNAPFPSMIVIYRGISNRKEGEDNG